MSRDYGFKTKKSLGQNFLQDESVICDIAEVSQADKNDLVVEIGPGLGVLTDELSERAGKVIAVELDDRLIPILNARFALHENVEIVHADILKYDWTDAIAACGKSAEKGGSNGEGKFENLRIVGNLPYYITTPILLGILEKRVPVKNITVMVQDEVADRIVASPGGKDYGVLSISLQYYAKVRKVLFVPAECFKPKPKVNSAVVELELKNTRPLDPEGEEKFFALVKKAFSQRRKTLPNSLAGIGGRTKEDIEKLLIEHGFSVQQRAETLTVEDYIELSKEI